MKVSEFLKLAKKLGCYFVEHAGRHDAWYSPITKKRFYVPRHEAQELKKGIEIALKKDAGIK